MARLDLSAKEQLAMLYVLVKQVSQEDLSSLVPKYGRSSPSFAAFADLVRIRGHHLDMLLRIMLLWLQIGLGSRRQPVKLSRLLDAYCLHMLSSCLVFFGDSA